jgi:LCP family protein required for cell wall assembly
VLIAGIGVLTLVVAVSGLAGAVLLRRYDAAVARADLLPPGARVDPTAHAVVLTGPLNFLLVGSDLRAANPEDGQRADTIMIAHVTRDLDQVYLVSIPRDLLVEIPAAPELDFWGDTTKINAAFEYGHGGSGGTQLLSLTLNHLVGVRFDGAAVFDFDGLRGAVDVLGGVEMCVDTRVVSIHTSRVFEPGCQLMDSADTLDYLRQRAFPDGDFTRQRHQQEFVKAVLDRAGSGDMLTNPFKLTAFLRAVAGATTIDTGGLSLTDLAFALRNLRPADVTGVKVPHYYRMIGALSFVVGSEQANDLYAAVRQDALGAWTAAHPEWVNQL